ncbi:ribosomal protein L1p/L10e family-domain-containing protein [Xylariaceae sp. FL0804]|nr:ribosomal protein L1p/L10e family-domain-containing protein [Xylariaceae sp. FL0804]
MSASKTVATRSQTAVSPVDPDQTLKASRALLAHLKRAAQAKAASSEKRNLLEGDEGSADGETPIWLTVTTKKHIVESRNLKPQKIVLPHPLNTDPEMGICLITAEPQCHYKNMIASDEFPAEWRKRVTRVVDIAKLKAKHKSFEQQRRLLAEHDVFLGDTRIINRLPALLGKTFYKTTAKRPIPVELVSRSSSNSKSSKVDGKQQPKALLPPPSKKKKDAAAGEDAPVNACTPQQLAAEVERAVGAALVHLAPSTSTTVRVGRAGWEAGALAANADAAAAAVVARFVSGGWRGVRGVFVKGPETAALPVWQTDELWADAQRDILLADGGEGEGEGQGGDDDDGGSKKDKAKKSKAKAKAERANVGKKRKALGEGDGEEEEEEETAAEKKKKKKEADEEPAAKKPKKSSKKSKSDTAAAAKLLPESDDKKLDKEIAERKAALKKQKKEAKKAVEA